MAGRLKSLLGVWPQAPHPPPLICILLAAAAGGTALVHAAPVAPRHVLLIVVDDYGFGDASYKNSMYNGTAAPPTPTIDKFATQGVRLESYYVQKLCSPTRTALLSGRYAYTIGQEDDVIVNGQNCDMALNLLTVADRLQRGGWNTSAYGKWDAGMTVWGSTPTCRGFDHFRGLYGAGEDYFTHQASGAYDFHTDDRLGSKGPDPATQGVYTTEKVTSEVQAWMTNQLASRPHAKTFAYVAHQAVHGPMQVPARYIDDQCRALVPATHPTRLIYCGMVRAVDESVLNITTTYEQLGILQDTLLILTTDNGGHPADGGYNYPLRGQKATLYEGGVRGLGFVWGAGLAASVAGTVQHGLMHVVDWLPTLVEGVAGLSLVGTGRHCPTCNRTIPPLDGVNQWAMLSTGAPSARTEVLLGLQATACIAKPTPCDIPGEGAIRVGRWKLMHGHLGGFTGSVPKPCALRSGSSQRTSTPLPIPANESAPICIFGWNPPPRADGKYEPPRWPEDLNCTALPCAMPPSSTYLSGRTMLFDLEADMFEQHNVAEDNPEVVARLLARLQEFNSSYCNGARCLPDKFRPGIGPPGTPVLDPRVMGQTPVWLPWRGDPDPNACSTDRRAPTPPPNPAAVLHSHVGQLNIVRQNADHTLVGNLWCWDAAWPGGGVPAMTVRISVDGAVVKSMVANATRPPGFMNASGAPNLEHGLYFGERGSWVDQLAGPGKHRLDLDVFLDPNPGLNSSTTPLQSSPFCFTNGNATSSAAQCSKRFVLASFASGFTRAEGPLNASGPTA